MKRKMFLIVISVLVLCLTCGMLFVACNDKNEGNDNPDDDHNTNTGSAFDTFKDVVFELEDVKLDTTGAKEFNFGLDVTAADDASKSLFSLAFETLGGEEYIYGSVNGGAMTKFNGFDLGGTVETVLSWFGDSISIMGIPVELNANGFLGGVGGELLSALIGDAKVSSDGSAYAIVLNLEGIIGIISGEDAFLNLDQMIADAGLGDIFGMIIPAIGGLITPDGSDDASPATVTELVEAIADNYTLTFYFGFEDNTGKDAAAEKAAQPFGDLALSSKVMAAREADAQNLLNFALDGTAELKDADGTVTGRYDIDVDIDLDIFPLIPALLDCVTVDEEGVFGFSMDEAQVDALVAAIKEMGYISIEVNEHNLNEEGTFKKNILTIYSDFASGEAIVQLYGESIVIYPVALGGVYEFDAVASFIMNALSAAAEQPEEPAESTALELGGIDIMGLLGKVLALTNLDTSDIEGSLADISANGFTIKMSGVMDVIDTITDVDADIALGMTLRDLLPYLWKSADTMTIKIETALDSIFGAAERKPVEEVAAVKNNSTPSALISEVTDIGVQEVLYGSLSTGIDTMYTMKGISMLTGDEVEFKGYILGFEGAGIDFSKPGKQTVTVYIAAENKGDGLIGMLKDMLDLTGYPVFGIYSKEVTFDILTDDSTVESASLLDEDGNVVETISHAYAPEAKTGMQAPFELLDKYVSGAGYVVRFQITYKGETFSFNMTKDEFNAGLKILDENGEDITATALDASGDIILAAGNYQIQVTYGGWTATEPFAVSTIAIKPVAADQGAPVLGSQYNYGITVVETMPDGTEKTLTPSSLSYKVGSTTVNGLTGTFDAVGTPDSDNKFLVTLDKLTNSLGEHSVTVTVTSENGAIRVSSIKYVFGKVDTPEAGLTATSRGSFGFGESLDNQFTITVSGQKYTLHWTGSAWQAVYADGDNEGKVNSEINAIVELNWREKKDGDEVIFQGGPVQLSQKGYITNNPVTNGAANMQTVDWKVTVGDMSTTGNFSISPLYSNNAEKEVGDTHSITGSIYIYVDGTRRSAQIYWNAEAKKYDVRAYSYSGGVYTYYYHADFDSDVVLSYTVKDASSNDVTATVFDAEGKFAAAGEYSFTYTLTFGDVTYTFTSTATITAPAAEA